MLRLIIKDFYHMKALLPWLVAWLVFIIIRGSDPVFICLWPVIFSFALIAKSIVTDERYQVEGLICSLPLTRSTIVVAKYASTFLTILIGAVCGFLLGLIFWHQSIGFKIFWYGFLFLSAFFAILYPINFRYGFQLESDIKNISKVILIMVIGVILIVSLFVFVVPVHQVMGFIGNILKQRYVDFYLFLILALFSYLSYRLSVKFYKQREF
jgi:ABC-2 type transport system permease protein